MKIIIRTKNEIDLNRYDITGDTYKRGKYKFQGDTIELTSQRFKYANYTFNRYYLDKLNRLIIPLDKDNRLVRDSLFCFEITYAR